MSDGMRMMLGLTGYHYLTDNDQEKWKKFADYWRTVTRSPTASR